MFNSEIVVVLSGSVINFCLNGLWYLMIKRHTNTPQKSSSENPTPYLISFIGSLWASYGLFLMIKHIHPNSFSELLGIAIGAWLCILMALSAKHYAFSGQSLRSFAKDYLVDLLGIIVMSVIIWNG